MYFTEAMKFLAFRPLHFVVWAEASVYEKFIIPRYFKVLHSKILQILLNAPDVLAVLSFRKRNNYCISSSTNTMARLSTIRRNVATKFSKKFSKFF